MKPCINCGGTLLVGLRTDPPDPMIYKFKCRQCGLESVPANYSVQAIWNWDNMEYADFEEIPETSFLYRGITHEPTV